jgi:hypothetical protein
MDASVYSIASVTKVITKVVVNQLISFKKEQQRSSEFDFIVAKSFVILVGG